MTELCPTPNLYVEALTFPRVTDYIWRYKALREVIKVKRELIKVGP